MKCVLFTSQDIGAELVNYLATRPDVEPLIVTMESVRDRIYGYRSTVDACVRAGFRHLIAPTVTDKVAAAVKDYAPKFIVCAYYSAVLPNSLLSLCPVVNVHPGKLPYYKGKFPTPAYILNGEKTFGIALHEVTPAIDGGAVLVQREFPIGPDETGFELLGRTMKEAAKVVIEHFHDIEVGRFIRVPQSGEGSTYSRIDKRIQIDWQWSAEHIRRQVRVHARPYFPAYSFIFNRIILVNRALTHGGTGKPGVILSSGEPGRSIVVGCGEGIVELVDYEVAPAMTADEHRLHFQAGNSFD